MSKVKLLLDVVSDLRSLADSVQAVADAIASNGPNEGTKPEQPKPEKQPEEKQITLEEVRAVLAEKSHDGFTAEVRALLESMVHQNSARLIQASMLHCLQMRRD